MTDRSIDPVRHPCPHQKQRFSELPIVLDSVTPNSCEVQAYLVRSLATFEHRECQGVAPCYKHLGRTRHNPIVSQRGVAPLVPLRGRQLSQALVGPGWQTPLKSEEPQIEFEEDQLDALPIESGVLAGAICWYSIIHTPPDRLAECFDELARVLMPGGYLLLAFQAEGGPVHREDAFGPHLPLTSYRHSVKLVADRLEDTGFTISTTVLRAPELEHETTSQGFVVATRHRP